MSAPTRQQLRGAARRDQGHGNLALTVATAVGMALERVLAEHEWQPACAVCVAGAKVREAVATRAAEPVPQREVNRALTVTGGTAVCWEHADGQPVSAP